ncbi:MAG: hypothetical protein ACR2G7_06610 [Acidimicrobiales bacterium]
MATTSSTVRVDHREHHQRGEEGEGGEVVDDDGLGHDEDDVGEAEGDHDDADHGHHPRHGPPPALAVHEAHQELDAVEHRTHRGIRQRSM